VAVPYPTARDRLHAASAIRANAVLADGATHEKTAFLHCTAEALERLITLRGRADYARLTPVPGERASTQTPAGSSRALLGG